MPLIDVCFGVGVESVGRVEGFGSRVSGLGLKVWGLGLGVLGRMFRVSEFEYWAWGLGFRVSSFKL